MLTRSFLMNLVFVLYAKDGHIQKVQLEQDYSYEIISIILSATLLAELPS